MRVAVTEVDSHERWIEQGWVERATVAHDVGGRVGDRNVGAGIVGCVIPNTQVGRRGS